MGAIVICVVLAVALVAAAVLTMSDSAGGSRVATPAAPAGRDGPRHQLCGIGRLRTSDSVTVQPGVSVDPAEARTVASRLWQLRIRARYLGSITRLTQSTAGKAPGRRGHGGDQTDTPVTA